MCNLTQPFCSRSIPGLYRYLGPACSAGFSCTACSESPLSGEIECVCEKLPFRTVSQYGQACGLSSDCSIGSCFRPCSTYLFSPDCPVDRCAWSLNPTGGTCTDFVRVAPLPVWTEVVAGLPPNETMRGQAIVKACEENNLMFPITYSALSRASANYMVQNQASLQSLLPLDIFFMLLDADLSGQISKAEFSALPTVLASIAPSRVEEFAFRRLADSTQLLPALTGSDIALCLNLTSDSAPSLVAACADPNLQGLICNADEGKFYCHLTGTCLARCSEGCSWLNAVNSTSFRCTPASIFTCKNNFFCPSLSSCVSDCSTCSGGLQHPDTLGRVCRSLWWGSLPPETGWVCGFRKSAGQACQGDMDCVYGSRICSDVCLPASSTCSVDRDCGIGQYCPNDPTGGEDPFYVKNCKPQGKEGDFCQVDGDCGGEFRCNLGACRRLFSISEKIFVLDPLLCTSGQTGVDGACSAVAFKSRRVGQACTRDEDCPTYDESGSLGSCECVGWWDSSASACKRCTPVFGDFSDHGINLKKFLSDKATYCASFWTLDECRSESGSVESSYNRYMCERQRLAGGVSLLSPDSGCFDDKAVKDYCALLN